jgi:hypothetical protein
MKHLMIIMKQAPVTEDKKEKLCILIQNTNNKQFIWTSFCFES